MTQVSDQKNTAHRKIDMRHSLCDMLNDEALDLYNQVTVLHSSKTKNSSSDDAFRYLIRSAVENTSDSRNWSKRPFSDSDVVRSANNVDYRIAAYNILLDNSKTTWKDHLERHKAIRKANWQIIRGAIAITAGAILFTMSFFM